MDDFDDEQEEATPEQELRAAKLKKKIDIFMGEIGEDMLDQEAIDLTERKTKELFIKNSIPYTRSSLTAFTQGLEFGLSKENSMIMMIIIAQKSIIRKMSKSKVSDELMEKSLRGNKETDA